MKKILTSAWFWLNLIAIALAVLQYFLDNQMFTDWIKWEGLGIVVLNMLAGMIQGQTVTKLKSQVNECKARFNYQPK
jgi:hypothetical protein